MVAAWMWMKRGCRVAVATDTGAHVEPLRRWGLPLKALPNPGPQGIEELLRLARADALFVGTRGRDLGSLERPRASVPVFEPVIGLGDDEIAEIAARIRAAISAISSSPNPITGSKTGTDARGLSREPRSRPRVPTNNASARARRRSSSIPCGPGFGSAFRGRP